MPRTATVNYHVHKPYRQAFQLDAGGVVGRDDVRAIVVGVRDELGHREVGRQVGAHRPGRYEEPDQGHGERDQHGDVRRARHRGRGGRRVAHHITAGSSRRAGRTGG